MVEIADVKAMLAAAWSRAGTVPADPRDWPPVALVTDPRIVNNLTPGWVAVRALVDGGTVAVMPEPAPDTPYELVRRWCARALAVSVGACPLCGAVAGLSRDPQQGRAAYYVLDVTVTVAHEPGCGALLSDDECRRWLQPFQDRDEES